MSHLLRILLVEDSSEDAFLLLRNIKKSGYEITHQRVQTPDAMKTALQKQEWDIVISDYSMPQFSAPAALALLKESDCNLPFIIVSRVVGEEIAVEAMRSGALDYIRKDNLTRLVPAIERELRDAKVRRAGKQARVDFEESQRILSTLMANLPGMAYRCINNTDWEMEFVSQGCFGLTGYQPSDLIHNKKIIFNQLIVVEDRDNVRNEINVKLHEGRSYQLIYRITTADREIKWVWEKGRGILDNDGEWAYLEGFITDITDRKRTEEERDMLEEQLRNTVLDSIISVDQQCNVLKINQSAATLFNVDSSSVVGAPLRQLCASDRQSVTSAVEMSIKTGQFVREFQLSGYAEGRQWTYSIGVTPLKGAGTEGAILVIRDISRLHSLEQRVQDRYAFSGIIGKSPAIVKIFDIINHVADTDSTVLIQGSSGTGKELIASAIHHHSSRKDGPFVKVNCAALPENLLESELFGHVRGAFTGALHDKRGRFDMADGGTIFLDEIGDISLSLQLRLLRVLQEREFERVGSNKTQKVNIRILAATNRNLAKLVEQNDFREDLYYRLNVVSIHLPSLRERPEDIPLLIHHFQNELQIRTGVKIKGIDSEAMDVLLNYGWPGNVRQLENAIEHAAVLSKDGYISLENLPNDLIHIKEPINSSKNDVNQPIDSVTLKQILVDVGWKRSLAAKRLNVHRSTLWRMMKEYGITPPEA